MEVENEISELWGKLIDVELRLQRLEKSAGYHRKDMRFLITQLKLLIEEQDGQRAVISNNILKRILPLEESLSHIQQPRKRYSKYD